MNCALWLSWLAFLPVDTGLPIRGLPADGTEELRATTADGLERLVLDALARLDMRTVASLNREVEALKGEQGRRLGLLLRPGVVEFRFRGTFPAPAFDPGMFEYVIAKAGDKDYEAALAVDRNELARLSRLGAALDTLARRGTPAMLEIRLAWADPKGQQVRRLADILRLLGPGARQDFEKALRFNEHGLGAHNVKADATMLPGGRVPAEVRIAVSFPPAGPGN